jgi:glycosyltransferase involved in cell wall biosynthesis
MAMRAIPATPDAGTNPPASRAAAPSQSPARAAAQRTTGSGPGLCWVLISAIHYHDARFDCFARETPYRLSMIQITDNDLFAELSPDVERGSFSRQTLFPASSWREIDSRELARSLHRRLDALSPAIVCINGWSVGGCIASLDWCLRQRVPVVLFSDSSEHDEPRRWWKEAIKGRIVRLCSAALIAGKSHRRYVEKLGMPAERIFDGYDVVDNAHFVAGADAARCQDASLRASLGLPANYFIACSRFEAKKNLLGMLDAYAIYRQKAGAGCWPLIILGDGPQCEREALEARRRQLGLDDDVQLPGFKSYRELPIYYGLARAFLHLSTVDQWALVVNEAMASGLPVIVSRRCGSAAELVIDGVNGFTVEPDDHVGIADAMVQIATGGERRRAMGQESRRIIAGWGPQRFARNLAAAVAAAEAAPRPAIHLLDRIILWMVRARSN